MSTRQTCCSILIAIMVVFGGFQVSAEDVDIELKGLLMTSSSPKQIHSPWGVLENSTLLLNKPQKMAMKGKKLSIVFGLLYFDAKSANTFDGNLGITNTWTAKTPMKVKMFQDKDSGKWFVTDGFVAIEREEMVVFNGLEISVIGGKRKPLVIAGKSFSDAVVEIKNNNAVLKSKTD